MSYIHRFNVNHYRPGENLKNLFEELVIQPYNNHPPESKLPPNNPEIIKEISGLRYISGYITEHQHNDLLAEIDKHKWLGDLKRRVQHYGYKYDYKARKVIIE